MTEANKQLMAFGALPLLRGLGAQVVPPPP